MAAAITAFYVLSDALDGNSLSMAESGSLRAIAFLSMFSPVAGIVAAAMWWLFHRNGRTPGWFGYALLSLLVVFVSHVLVFGSMVLVSSDDLLRDLIGAAALFLIHGWLSVPVALLGTAVFVRWVRRRNAPALRQEQMIERP